MNSQLARWKPVTQCPGYQVSDEGEIRNLKGRILRQQFEWGGLSVNVRMNGYNTRLRVAHAVGRAFCPDYVMEKCAEYLDGDRKNCRWDNLRWVPRSVIAGVPYSKNPKAPISVG